MTFINKLDRDGRQPIELLDEIEKVLGIRTTPITWPIGMGRELRGIYHLLEDRIYAYSAGEKGRVGENLIIDGLASPEAREFWETWPRRSTMRSSSSKGLPKALTPRSTERACRRRCSLGRQSTISGSRSCCVVHDACSGAAAGAPREKRLVEPFEDHLTGFVFKIQANMDPMHRDRIAFMRLCSGKYSRGMRLFTRASPRRFALRMR